MIIVIVVPVVLFLVFDTFKVLIFFVYGFLCHDNYHLMAVNRPYLKAFLSIESKNTWNLLKCSVFFLDLL